MEWRAAHSKALAQHVGRRLRRLSCRRAEPRAGENGAHDTARRRRAKRATQANAIGRWDWGGNGSLTACRTREA
jgi:hypothetical protein